ncbi:unnamed protein product [Cylicocyclus nassatus]|uniref:Uncharacterized protein n=1 Tax=Cylicocyclus nassatus TaxID=53992 RepID=A0AA36DKL0_CYLNA|nr:unnamed protein product [Cylicocyclus nassatus]
MDYLVFILPLFFFSIIPVPITMRVTRKDKPGFLTQCAKVCEETARKVEKKKARKLIFNAKTRKYVCNSYCAMYMRNRTKVYTGN